MAVAGPLAKTTDDIVLTSQILLSSAESSKLDITVPTLPFNKDAFDQTLSKKLRIGVIEELPLLPLSKAMRRAMEVAKDALTKHGCELVPFSFSRQQHLDFWLTYLKCTNIAVVPQMAKCLRDGYESPIAIYKDFFMFFGLPRPIKKLLQFIITKFVSERLGLTLSTVKTYNSFEIDDIIRDKLRFEKYFMEKWLSLGLDGCISPTFYHSSFRH